MQGIKGESVLYGLDNMNSELDSIVTKMNLKSQHFEIKLVISEAVNNAFVHGNNCDKSKPIFVKWQVLGKKLTLTVTDCGDGIKNLDIVTEINQNNILNESGRGLFIINCYADEVNYIDNSIIVKKYIM